MFERLRKLFTRKPKVEYVEVRTKGYKTVDQLTKKDYWYIDMDRALTGISGYSDEYFYNHILCHNYKMIKKEIA